MIHSPLVGPSCWGPTAGALASLGVSALAVDYGGVRAPDWYASAAARAAAALPDSEPYVVVVHSGAGGLAPSLADALGDRLAATLFVDAVLPHPGKAWFDTAPQPLAKRLIEIARDGWLPRWDRWFGHDGLASLLPDAGQRGRFIADQPELPVAFLEAPAPEGRAWRDQPSGYLQLSGAYEDEAAEAEARGWPVRREALNHLAMLTQPDRVAAMLCDMASELASN